MQLLIQTFDPVNWDAIATEMRAAGPSAVAPCSLSLGRRRRKQNESNADNY